MTDVADPSAVDLFGDWHDRDDAATDGPTAYRALMPATAPGPGQQYRFEVDLDRCTGCKACVTACHSLNGLDEDETWRSVGLLVGRSATASAVSAPVAAPVAVSAWQQHVTTACHHCLEPACLAGCPVEAYEKDPITGIVSHLDDQCIGCRYCMLTCPYEVPTFNDRLGVVRKCDMCSDRLAVGEAPACVQGCPTDAISIGLVSTAELAAGLTVDPDVRLVPTAPRSALTGPTTVYLTRKPVPVDAAAADDHRIVPAHNHPPLVAMLVLTQLSVGAFVVSQLVERFGGGFGGGPNASAVPAFLAWATGVLAIGASVLHLGRPLVAWRAVLGLRHSWLSREIVAFGMYAPLGGVTAASAVGWLPSAWEPALGAVTAVVGLGGVWCSARLYAVTGRPFWRMDRTVVRFVVTMAGLGAPAVALATAVSAANGSASSATATRVGEIAAASVLGAAVVAISLGAAFVVRHHGRDHALGRSAWLLRGPLRARMATGAAAVALAAFVATMLAVAAPAAGTGAWWWGSVVLLLLAAAWIERGLFFVAAAPDRMPGGFR